MHQSKNLQIKMIKESEKTLSMANIIDVNRISSLPKLLRITDFLQLIGKEHTFRGITHCFTADDLRKTEKKTVSNMQKIIQMIPYIGLDDLDP